MGTIKKELFEEEEVEVSKLFKALAHPARVSIVLHLAKMNKCYCGEIVNELPLAQATVSQHLKELKEAGIVKGTIEGFCFLSCLEKNFIKKFLDFFNEINSAGMIQSSDNCC
ncbi:MAG: metalloregulator ArsR/SmtB family transcription factor [Cytophagales bacterium]